MWLTHVSPMFPSLQETLFVPSVSVCFQDANYAYATQQGILKDCSKHFMEKRYQYVPQFKSRTCKGNLQHQFQVMPLLIFGVREKSTLLGRFAA